MLLFLLRDESVAYMYSDLCKLFQYCHAYFPENESCHTFHMTMQINNIHGQKKLLNPITKYQIAIGDSSSTHLSLVYDPCPSFPITIPGIFLNHFYVPVLFSMTFVIIIVNVNLMLQLKSVIFKHQHANHKKCVELVS